MKRSRFWTSGFAGALAILAFFPGAGAAAPQTPLVITVDDLPLTPSSLHSDPAERRLLTKRLLAALDAHNISAVGFVAWGNVLDPDDLELLKMWLDAGHELGNHSFSHKSLSSSEAEWFISDIDRCQDNLRNLLGTQNHPPRFFRYPMLHEGNTLEKLTTVRTHLRASALRNLPVTIDSAESGFARPWIEAVRAGNVSQQQMIAEQYHEALHVAAGAAQRHTRRLFSRTVPQVLLLHANAIGSAEWDELFTWFSNNGYVFVDADKALEDPVFDQLPVYVGSRGPGLWYRIEAVREYEEAVAAVEEILERQQSAWNVGDFETFTSFYSDDTLFISSTGATRGRDEVLARYYERYPDPETRGALTFTIVDIRLMSGFETTPLGDSVPSRIHGASVAAQWQLERGRTDQRETLTGMTLLVLQPTHDGWKIVQDASL
jgi:peptidoglycan/xylan/chitin deacetylase (PgdA/CDA1 family)/ketosteroid isomerase-like protein